MVETMTDGVKHAMLRHQHGINDAIVSPWRVRKHLQQHHGIQESDTPLSHHAEKHTLKQLSQGHSMNADGDLFHGDSDPGTSNFASEAPPLVPPLELARHVRSAQGAAFYHKSIGTLLTGEDSTDAGYKKQKAKNDANKAAGKALEALRQEKRLLSHSDLLAQRKAAREKHPVGHPERLAAERAVRNSRKSTPYKDSRHNARQAQAPKSTTTSGSPVNRNFLIAGGARTSATTTGVGGSFSPKESLQPTDQVASRLKQLDSLSSGERSQYYALRNAGLHHDKAMKQVNQRRQRPKLPPKVVKAVSSRRRTRG